MFVFLVDFLGLFYLLRRAWAVMTPNDLAPFSSVPSGGGGVDLDCVRTSDTAPPRPIS